jgi:solute carrier family 25 phosphate transporter 23/24/25/41
MLSAEGEVHASPAQGLLPNYIKVVPSIAIAFVTYEKLKEALGVELRISS